MTLQVMVDLETLGTGPEALILSLGAVKFDAAKDLEIVDCLHVGIEPATAQAHGLKINAGTVLWWLHPERAGARDALLALERVDLYSALDGFRQWFGVESLPVWGNGATFDNVILRTAFQHAGVECPWQFWHDRCYRTVRALAPGLTLERTGTHHSALDAAITQVRHLRKLVQHLGIAL